MEQSLRLAEPAKPKRAFLRTIEKQPFSPTDRANTATPEPLEMVGANRSILVVDDNPMVLEAFEVKLKGSGFAVTTSNNPATVASVAEQSKAELIILDVNFQAGGGIQWTGLTVMQWLRRFPKVAKIPVILVTGGRSREVQGEGHGGGCSGAF
jgi:CheY-like chemotaxis protein